MRILAMHSGHDGAIAFIEDGVLRFSIEAEKDSFPRYSAVRAQLLIPSSKTASTAPLSMPARRTGSVGLVVEWIAPPQR